MEQDTISTIVAAIIAVTGGIFALTAQQQSTIVAGIVTIIGAVLAYYQQRQKTTVVAAYTAGTAESATPSIIAGLPERSWKMNDQVKEWLTFDATADNKSSILSQIGAAEANHLVSYQIQFKGGYYNIEYGLLKGSAGNPSGK